MSATADTPAEPKSVPEPAPASKDRRLSALALLGLAGGFRLARWTSAVDKIAELESKYIQLDDQQLRKESLSLRFRAKSGEKLARLLPEAYGLVREAGRRTLGMRHFDVQILGGMAIFHNCIAEMDTGEGKTLTATLPMYLHALPGKGAHLATVNDYLAARDAEIMGPVYRALGFTVGVIQSQDTSEVRREAYACDITYGTAKEFGFDFLRDRLLLRRMGHNLTDFLGSGSSQRWDDSGEKPVRRGSHFCLVDEADSILIDEARTPLIIGSLGDETREQLMEAYRWAAAQAELYVEDDHYDYDHEKKKVELSTKGRQLLRTMPQKPILRSVGLVDLYEFVERAVKVRRDYQLDREYVVRDGEIVIVDEYTGRIAEGRKWRDGIHQAIEAKEGVEVSVPTGQAARITVQDMFLRYHHLGGMTGTARTAASEFRKIYRMPVVRIPTNRPVQRRILPPRVFGNSEAKWGAIVDDIVEKHQQGRPVLIGTRSIDKSEMLSQQLAQRNIDHQVLNAQRVAEEADIVAQAGQSGRVTVATNMAGRGTDIKLPREVVAFGGLHVICTEMHESARIDRQLYGRCGRQGDPGTVQQYLSLDDEILLQGLGPNPAARWARTGAAGGEMSRHQGVFRRAQRKLEKKHFSDRTVLLHHEKQRKKLQREIGQDPYLDTAD